jgi:hypothetical protein
MASRDKFIKMCHSIYDSIHGKEKIVKIFHPINEEQLNVILQIYNKEFYHRFSLIDEYINTIPGINNKVKLIDGRELDTTSFYLNAVQHYTSKSEDYPHNKN